MCVKRVVVYIYRKRERGKERKRGKEIERERERERKSERGRKRLHNRLVRSLIDK